ncbi:Fur family transcriptional regulator [Streptomyces sp. NPDC004685]
MVLLSSRESHLSSAEVYAELRQMGERVDLATVYRSLEMFADVGLAHTVQCPGPRRYGAGAEPHHHAVCRECGQVSDLRVADLAEAARRIAELAGLRSDAGSLLIHGVCADCGD